MTSYTRNARKWIIAAFLLFVSCQEHSVWCAETGPLQPNIVHIMIDDLGWQDVACYYRDYHNEEPLYETPYMDRLASRGIRFMQAYSPAMTCSPSRAAFLTG